MAPLINKTIIKIRMIGKDTLFCILIDVIITILGPVLPCWAVVILKLVKVMLPLLFIKK